MANRRYTAKGLSYFDPNAFVSPIPVNGVPVPGNAGINSLRGPGLFNLDAALSREIHLFRESSLNLKVESFDLTNTPQFAAPAGNVAASNFGVISASNASDIAS